MNNFGFIEMQEIQKELREKYKDKWDWGELCPERAIEQLLWLYGELGEVSDVIKKNGNEAILNDKAVRSHFVEELCDVMMYFNDIMLCYSVSPDELKETYLKKHEINMSRW